MNDYNCYICHESFDMLFKVRLGKIPPQWTEELLQSKLKHALEESDGDFEKARMIINTEYTLFTTLICKGCEGSLKGIILKDGFENHSIADKFNCEYRTDKPNFDRLKNGKNLVKCSYEKFQKEKDKYQLI